MDKIASRHYTAKNVRCIGKVWLEDNDLRGRSIRWGDHELQGIGVRLRGRRRPGRRLARPCNSRRRRLLTLVELDDRPTYSLALSIRHRIQTYRPGKLG